MKTHLLAYLVSAILVIGWWSLHFWLNSQGATLFQPLAKSLLEVAVGIIMAAAIGRLHP